MVRPPPPNQAQEEAGSRAPRKVSVQAHLESQTEVTLVPEGYSGSLSVTRASRPACLPNIGSQWTVLGKPGSLHPLLQRVLPGTQSEETASHDKDVPSP